MTKIFINYRRTDSTWAATRIYEFIKAQLRPKDELFMDREALPLGKDFQKNIQASLDGCDVVLALIGPNWLETLHDRMRLTEPDYVRIELAAALARDIQIVPVLLEDASMPPGDKLPDDIKALVKRSGAGVTQVNFDADITRLMKGLGFKVRPVSGSKSKAGVLSVWPTLLTLVGFGLMVAVQHFLDMENAGAVPALLSLGSVAAGVFAAGGHGLRSSGRVGVGVFAVGVAAGVVAVVAAIVGASFITPDVSRDYGLLLGELLRDVSSILAAIAGSLAGLMFRPKPSAR